MADADYESMPDCCPAGAEPLLLMSNYEPKGEVVDVPALTGSRGVECYVSWPAEGATSAVIVFHDIFGIHTGRHKQFCDILADKGYGSIAPDFFNGAGPIVSGAPQYGSSLRCCLSFLCRGICCGHMKHRQRELSWGNSMRHMVLDCVVPFAHQKGATNLATVGFCFGAYGSIHCGKYPEVFSCNASFHPSTENFCKSTGEDDLDLCHAVRVPQLVVATSMESAKWQPGGEAQSTCEATGTPTTWYLEDTQRHGFMMRGDTTNAETLCAIKKWLQVLFEFLGSNVEANSSKGQL